MSKRKELGLRTLIGTGMFCATLLFGAFFTSVRTNAISAESFEAGPQLCTVEAIDSFDALVE